MTTVTFLKNEEEGDVFARFYTGSRGMVDVFDGQHATAHIDYIAQCKEAEKSEYKHLKNQLIELDYSLNITNQ